MYPTQSVSGAIWYFVTGPMQRTRCRWKSQVDGGLCEREVPPIKILGDNHQIKCHLSEEVLARMEPVIKIAAE